MILNLTKKDNDIISNHISKFNQGVETHMRLAVDVYINFIEFKDDDIILYFKITEPILDDFVTKENVGISSGEIGDEKSISISRFDEPYRRILYTSIREIKLERII